MSDKRLIDRDELLKHEVMIITKGNATFHGVPSSLIETAPVIVPSGLCVQSIMLPRLFSPHAPA